MFVFFSSRRRHTRFKCDWSSDVCSSDLKMIVVVCVCVCRGGLFQCECFDAEAVKTAHGYQGVSLLPFHFLKGSLPLSLSLALSICLSLSFPLSLLSPSLSLTHSVYLFIAIFSPVSVVSLSLSSRLCE